MSIIINNSSMVPIYEQIVEQIKTSIVNGELKTDDPLPSVRSLAKDLRISALTVKKAYDELEYEGYTATIHGKGTYVTEPNRLMMREEQRKDVEQDFELAIQKAHRYGISKEEIQQIFDLIMEEKT